MINCISGPNDCYISTNSEDSDEFYGILSGSILSVNISIHGFPVKRRSMSIMYTFPYINWLNHRYINFLNNLHSICLNYKYVPSLFHPIAMDLKASLKFRMYYIFDVDLFN